MWVWGLGVEGVGIEGWVCREKKRVGEKRKGGRGKGVFYWGGGGEKRRRREREGEEEAFGFGAELG